MKYQYRIGNLYFLLSFTFVLILFFPGCADETGHLPGPEIGEGYAQLTISLGTPHTRAGDPFTTPEEEVEIHSVACFVKTNDTAVPGASGYKQGSFHSFFSDITPGEENGFEEALKDNGDGTYSINLHIRSSSFTGQTPVIMITNYKENGLASRLKAVREWDDLESFRTEELTETGIGCPLLMYARAEVALQSGQSSTQIFNLQRIMSRIDIYNKVPSDAAKPFVLLSARIVSPKLYSYLLPGNDGAYYIPVLPEGFTPKIPGSDPTKIEGLYTYETANDGSTEHTAIEVTGTFGGEPYTRLIKLLKGNDPVPLGRNTRYQISLDAPPGATEISFTFKIEDWSEGEVIPVLPGYDKPVLKQITFTKASPDGLVDERYWNASTKMYNLAYVTTGDKIHFTVTGNQENDFDISFDKDDGSSLGLHTPADIEAFVTKKPAVVTRNSVVEQEFEIQFPQRPVKDIEVYIHIRNIARHEYKETLHLSCWYYPGTTWSPVLLAGIYWAPINVGQKVLESATQTVESMGYVYQWGRNKPFSIYPPTALPPEQMAEGPLPYSIANSGSNADKYIYVTVPPNDWISDGFDIRNALWVNGRDGDTPCPVGWRLPTKDEEEIIAERNKNNTKLDDTKCRFIFDGDDGQDLYFPYGCWINFTNGKGGQDRRILNWSSTLFDDISTGAYFLNFYASGAVKGVSVHPIAYAFGVRCVRDTRE